MKIIIVLLYTIFIMTLIIGPYIVIQLIRGLQLQVSFLRANLIKQKEVLQQAERKNINKSLAFASASHDVRTSLAGITGLIDLCLDDAPPNSELNRNLLQMSVCASKLLEILNSILDTSKVEAGKIQLEEVEFDMAQVLEESADFFNIVALKRGLEVIWDPCDCSVLRSRNVRGDCKRLKQILDNLLGNAVKFTSDGHVVLRAWCKKPNRENFKHSPKHGWDFLNMVKSNLKWHLKEEYTDTDLGALNSIRHDPNSIEFIFEIDDTGIGIPKEKRASAFENYVQVNESSSEGPQGTGLGLGIVQSFVRQMGGEINIQDKESSQRGTCFRFNIFLKSNEACSNTLGEMTNSINNHLQWQNSSTTIAEYKKEYSKVQPSARAMAFDKGLKAEGIHCISFIQGEETRKIIGKWLVDLGVKVCEVHNRRNLYSALEYMKQNLSTSGTFDIASQNSFIYEESSSRADQLLPLTIKDLHKRARSKHLVSYLLVIIDLSSEDIPGICSILKDFAKSINNSQLKVVLLANPNSSNVDLESLKQVPCDLTLHKPFHGSRIYEVLRLLHAFGEENKTHSVEKGSTSMTTETSFPAFNLSRNEEKQLAGITILLVEDTPSLQHLASIMLSRDGATVEYANNGLEALDLVRVALREATNAEDEGTRMQIKQFYYDIILMDCEMPVMNGYEATRRIREEEQRYGIHIPIVAITGHATSEKVKETIAAGMDFHLTKPLKHEKLIEAIRLVSQN